MSVAMIDAHVHFWDMNRNDDILIVRREPSLARQAMPEDLRPLMADAGIIGAVAIQSAPDASETDHLIDVSASMAEVRGVVGWVDLGARDVRERVRLIAARPKIVGVRAMLNRVDPVDWLAEDRIRPGLVALVEADLSLDVIARAEHAPAIAAVAADLPELRIVVDHGASAPLRRTDRQDWIGAIERLAALPSISTKFSGLAEEAPEDWTPETLEPAFQHLLACFGPARIMWASNWPVINLRGGYAGWVSASRALLDRADLALPDRLAIEDGNARRIYRIAAM
jgi:L-fuconolactonase